jgi:hypothetical protein
MHPATTTSCCRHCRLQAACSSEPGWAAAIASCMSLNPAERPSALQLHQQLGLPTTVSTNNYSMGGTTR